ncbi:hypothetical protein C4D60_Mb06t22790 [Musa balbisiana]|uniref:Uncharacterized protein n=1 Tax=Musa balbisiana TaxID=52838 RepID=A0A4S8IR89_MUSBA|nr:hypothetical protein C4D60_Mb06t22790 [Musa balbisiana]
MYIGLTINEKYNGGLQTQIIIITTSLLCFCCCRRRHPAGGCCAAEGGAALACRPLAALPLQVGVLAGAAASAGGSALGAAPTGGAAPPGGHPCRGGFASGSSDRKRRCPAVPHPAGEAAAGAAALRCPCPRVQWPQAPQPTAPLLAGAAAAGATACGSSTRRRRHCVRALCPHAPARRWLPCLRSWAWPHVAGLAAAAAGGLLARRWQRCHLQRQQGQQ